MSWLPAFKLGLWNAWIPMLIFLLNPLLLIVIDKAVGTGEILKKMDSAPPNPVEKRANTVYSVFLYLLIAYSIFLPLKLNTAWFYAGLVIYLVGLTILLIAIVNAATTPSGQLFSNGIYRYSRHPMYLSLLMILISVGIASASWVFLLFSIVIIFIFVVYINAEERSCLELFGDEYQEYITRTPRWMGIPRTN